MSFIYHYGEGRASMFFAEAAERKTQIYCLRCGDDGRKAPIRDTLLLSLAGKHRKACSLHLPI